ncbi:MAG: flagellar biosynthesis protein FliQ [Thermacetogeniaceae bacterium]|jgi:flagellar biosynthetic protein FliQ
MTEGYIITLGREALYTTLLICAPLLGVSLIIGLTIGIFQATTQLQDISLSFVPKIVAVLIMVVIFAPWIMNILVSFTQNLFMSIQNFTR